MTNAPQSIIKSLAEQPDRWVFGEHTADHDSGLSLWVANGTSNIAIYAPFKQRLTRSWRRQIKAAIFAAKDRRATELINKKPPRATEGNAR